jgi:drug/metabolite transporter (DMT)-like permease
MPGVCRLHRYTFAAGAPFAVFLLPPFALLLPVSLALGKDPLGSRRIDKVKLSDAKIWLIKLKQERFTVQSAIGGGLILVGILVSELPDSKSGKARRGSINPPCIHEPRR